MVKRILLFWCFLAPLVCGADTVLHDNGAPDLTNGFEMTHWIQADQFTLGNASTLNSVRFWDAEASPAFQGTIVWEIFSDNGANRPGVLLFSGTSTNVTHTATGRAVFGIYPEFVNDVGLPSVSLPAGTYWLALHNGPLSNNTGQDIFWETSLTVSTIASVKDVAPFAGNWQSNLPVPSKLAFQLYGVAAPQLSHVDSVMTHGTGVGAPQFPVPLPPTGPRGVECRSGGANGNYTLVYTFVNDVMSADSATVVAGAAMVDSIMPGPSSNQYTVKLTGVTNRQYVTIRLDNAHDSTNAVGNVFATMGVLLGDLNGLGSVNSTDVSQVQFESGHVVSDSNFRADVTPNNAINSSDVSTVQAQSGTALSPPP